MQERKQTINGYEVTVLVNDEDAEAFDEAEAAREQSAADVEQQKQADEPSTKARKTTANK